QFLAWPQDDRDKAIWQHIRTTNTCPQCGTRPEEWDPKQGGDRNAYIGDLRRCRGCEVLEREQAAVAKENLGRGIYVGLRRRRKQPG
ncbi:MAG TPA: hypothetical protein VIV12_10500, partial [Streptosporangiaceae bacterium]